MMMNIGNSMMGYGMNNINSMMGMGMNTGSQNVPQYFQQKYGCVDCFKSQPYLQEYPKPLIALSKESIPKNFFQRFINKIFG